MFESLLIANRGEIACRIIKTAKKMGIRCIAVYSEADIDALHVTLADDAFAIGPSPAVHSYLNPSKIIDAALQTGAKAIHPGYGFLAENAKFAESCHQHHLIFIGPSPSAIAAMGNKIAAKQQMEKVGIPVIPGYGGNQQDNATLTQEAHRLGLPLMIKASVGGGGRGMRLVTQWQEFPDTLTSAQREARHSFDDDAILLEKYLSPVRHIEVQIFRDAHGQAVSLFTRDCSLQRRHQKIIEEAPAPLLSPKLSAAMIETALRIAAMIDYIGVGTVEFLVDAHENYYFMEMNTRLQVEHPVTEMITGIDLVEWQLRAAALEALPYQDHPIHCHGHAFEALICAENPQEQFAPSSGKITHIHFPPPTTGIRVDTGIQEKDCISTEYDSLLAKLITWGKTREEALHLLKNALEQTAILGVHTNVAWLCNLIATPDFQHAHLHTQFISQHADALFLPLPSLPQEIAFIAALIECKTEKKRHQYHIQISEDPTSPWFWRNHWRLMGPSPCTLSFWYHHQKIELNVIPKENNEYQFHWNGQIFQVYGDWDTEHHFVAHIGETRVITLAWREIDYTEIFYRGQSYTIYHRDPTVNRFSDNTAKNQLRSPMPGILAALFVTPGEKVIPGQRLAIMEAMKIEHPIIAPIHGIIQKITHSVGDRVAEGVVLFQLDEIQ